MEKTEYFSSTQVAGGIFPGLSLRILQRLMKEELVRPAIPSTGTGHPARFSYLNLMEIATFLQLKRLGVDSQPYRSFLQKLLYSGKHTLIERAKVVHDFDCVLIIPSLNEIPGKESAYQVVHFLRPLRARNEGQVDFADFIREGIFPAYILVDLRMVKSMVDRGIQSFME